MGQPYIKEYTVGFQQTDCFGHLFPSALQSFMIDTGTYHSESLGLSREHLPDGAVWVITDCHVFLDRPIPYRSALRVTTWYRGSSGPRLFRDFRLEADGKPVGGASTSWILFARDTGRILRPRDICSDDLIYRPEEPNLPAPEKFLEPDGLTVAGIHTVGYTDLDVNSHMNNVRYLDLCCDALELSPDSPVFFSKFSIQYIKETLPLETLTLFKAAQPDGRMYVSGKDDGGHQKFRALISLSAPIRHSGII